MKQYRTLVQVVNPKNIPLEQYLDQQGITYRIGADFADDLRYFGYGGPASYDQLLHTYCVLIEDYELSAIKLVVDDVDVIRNRRDVEIKNKIRNYFSWFLD